MLATLAMISVCPVSVKGKAREFVSIHYVFFTCIYWAFVIVFLGFGIARGFLAIATGAA